MTSHVPFRDGIAGLVQRQLQDHRLAARRPDGRERASDCGCDNVAPASSTRAAQNDITMAPGMHFIHDSRKPVVPQAENGVGAASEPYGSSAPGGESREQGLVNFADSVMRTLAAGIYGTPDARDHGEPVSTAVRPAESLRELYMGSTGVPAASTRDFKISVDADFSSDSSVAQLYRRLGIQRKVAEGADGGRHDLHSVEFGTDFDFVAEDADKDRKASLEDGLRELEKLDCEENRDTCLDIALSEVKAGIITDIQYVERRMACLAEFERCEKWNANLKAAAALAKNSPGWKVRTANDYVRYRTCRATASRIADPVRRAQALRACDEELTVALADAGAYGDIAESTHWHAAMARYLPLGTESCPCCVNDMKDLEITTSGPLKGASSYLDYGPFDKAFPDEVFRRTGSANNAQGWAFGIEFSHGYRSQACPCEDCEWTQFVRIKDKWCEDRAGSEFCPEDEDVRRSFIGQWNKQCKSGRMYIGDIVQQYHPSEARPIVVRYFRTMFFSSGTNCDRKWVAVDWKLTARRIAPGESVVTFAELGRTQA